MTKKEIQKMVTEQYSQNKDTMLIERVACYVRVSHEEQKLHGISLDAQKDKLKEYAEKHHLKIVEWYMDEGISGRKLIKHRPALQQMLHDAQEGKFDRIIFIKLDRFFRSVAEYHECMKLIDPVLWTATEEKYDLTTANGRAFVNMKLTIAELEADQTGERINLVNDYKIKTGQPLTGSHRLGLAYKVGRDPNTGLKNVIKDPETEEMVKDLLDYFLTYQSKKGTQRYINNKYNTSLCYTSINTLLSDTKLYGYYRGNDNYCEPYIDKATFDKIQEISSKNIKVQKSRRVYLFSGLIICPICGYKLKATNNSKGYYGYRCGKKVLNGTCTFSKTKSERKLEAYLLENLDTYVNAYISDAHVEDAAQKLDVTSDKIKQVKKEMSRLNNMYRKERISEAEYDRDYEELEIELKDLESRLEPVKERDLSKYQELLKSGWRELYGALTRENKRAFWRKYIKEIHLTEDAEVKEIIFF